MKNLASLILESPLLTDMEAKIELAKLDNEKLKTALLKNERMISEMETLIDSLKNESKEEG